MSQRQTPKTLLQLLIELRYTDPLIWRRVLVPDTTTLVHLHAVIRESMGWRNGHLHEFDIAGSRYGMIDPEWDVDPELINEAGKNCSMFLLIKSSSTTSMTLVIPGCIESHWRRDSR